MNFLNRTTKKLNTYIKDFSNYKSKLYYVIIVLCLYSAVIATFNYLSSPKIGYIDSSKLLEQYPAAKKAREEFNSKSITWQENVKTLETELIKLNKELLENSNSWSKQFISERQEEIKKKQLEYNKYGKAISEKASELEKKLFEPIYTEINNKVNEFGSEKGYQIIFGTLAGGNILYGNNNNDLTSEFLTYVQVN